MKYLGSIIAAALLCNGASADMQLTMTEKHEGAKDGSSETVISVRNGKVLFQGSGGESGVSAIYDAKTGSLTQVDHTEKMYVVMDKKAMKEASGQMSEMMKQVEAQLANLPKEQREMMMKSMPGLAGGMGEDKEKNTIEVEWTGEKKRVAGYPCKVATVLENGKADGKACVARPKDLGMSDEDFETLASMLDTMRDFADSMSGDSGMPDMREIGGFPIETSDAESGSRSTLKSASDESLDSDIFEVPASYKQQSMTGF